ncbi:histidine kinase dimerization/phospho-acceptor domain-containing protein, partial [Mycobacterium kansasii]
DLTDTFNSMLDRQNQSIDVLRHQDARSRRFVGDVSHELRTPLTTVRMAADMIADSADELDPGLRRTTELMQKELDRFETLLAELLEISRHDAGVAELHSE